MADMPSAPPDLQDRVDALRNSNKERAAALAAQGVNIGSIHEIVMLITLLCEREIGRDPEFELAIERGREEIVVAHEQALTRAKLVVP